MESIWEKTAQLPTFEPLRRDIRADALVIGGGLAGLLCAHELTQAGLRCVVAEAGRICGGVTKNTTAKLTTQHGLVFHKLLKRFGAERARACLDANAAALDRIRALCQDIPCDFEEKPNYVYSLDNPRLLERELAALDRLGRPAALAKNLPLPFSVAGAVRFDRQAQFHPLKFAAAIAEKLPIFEHTRVLEVETGRAVTEHGAIKAEHIVVATHFPFLNKFGAYWLKLYQSRSYVLALKGGPELDGIYVDASGKGLSFRNYGDLLLLGGEGRRTGKKSGGWQALEGLARRWYPEARVVSRWAAQDCMTLDGLPYIGRFSRRRPFWYVATGFGKWGMSMSMASAGIISALILEKKSPVAYAFSPQREFSPRMDRLFSHVVYTLQGMTKHLLPSGKKVFVPNCPHMGCRLEWNPEEETWDCPCHGSRFDQEGRLIDDPAKKDCRRR